MNSPWAIVPPNGVCAARSGSTWIHWKSSVTSANALTASCVTSYQSLTPSSVPTAALSSSMPVMTVGVAMFVSLGKGREREDYVGAAARSRYAARAAKYASSISPSGVPGDSPAMYSSASRPQSPPARSSPRTLKSKPSMRLISSACGGSVCLRM